MHDISGVESIALYICYEVTVNMFYKWYYAQMQIRRPNVNIYSHWFKLQLWSWMKGAGNGIVKVKSQLLSSEFVTENPIHKMSQPSHVLVSDQRCNSYELMYHFDAVSLGSAWFWFMLKKICGLLPIVKIVTVTTFLCG